MGAAEFKKKYTDPAPLSRPKPAEPAPRGVVRDAAPYRAGRRTPPVPVAVEAPETFDPVPPPPPVTLPAPAKKVPAPAPEQTVLDERFAREPFRLIGEALGVYILLEQGDKLIVIDKHAAHERLLFDKMRLNEKPLMSQELMEPLTFTTDPDGADLVEKNLDLLSRLGYEAEPFGESAFVLRGVPADIDAAAAVPLLEELVEKLREGRALSAADVWERLAATVACKAAVKANTPVADQGLLALAEKVLAGEVTHCPHGRPVMTVFTRAELDKRFGRIV